MEQGKRAGKHVNITLSFPSDLNALLHAKVENRGISKYVTNAVWEALRKDKLREMEKLEAAYEEASKDPARRKVVEEWNVLDGANNDIEGWEW